MYDINERILKEAVKTGKLKNVKIEQLIGCAKQKDGKASQYNFERYLFMADSPFKFAHMCCNVMKKTPMHKYSKETGRVAITAQMASESKLRTQQWIRNGCNGFTMKSPISNPMSFWTEQDVLLYIYENKIPIASVYGNVVKEAEIEGQMDILEYFNLETFDLYRPTFHTTGCQRTGCMFCGFGCHREKPGSGRFERLKTTHPKIYDYIMRPWEEGGLNYKEVIDWLNENGDLHINY